MIYNEVLQSVETVMVRRLMLVLMICSLLLTGVGCRLCDRNGRMFNRDWSSREKDRPKPLDDGTGGFLREPVPTDDRIIRSPDLPPTSGGMDLPPMPETRQRFVPDAPAKPGRELLLPMDEPKGSSTPSPSPSRTENGLLGTPEPLDNERESKKSPASTDLDGYTRVKNTIACGRVPTASGMEKLKTAGFKSVAYLHEPNANVDGVRRDAEAKGLKFISVPFGSAELADGMKAFTGAVADRDNKPLYVCDDDGMRTGMAWYAWFRTVEFANDDSAKLLAAPLGLTETSTGDSGTFWIATQKYLANRP